MSKGLKILAIVVLLATVAGAGAVLYGINTLTPAVEQVRVDAVPAAQAQEAFDTIVRQIEDGTFAGRVYGGAENAANLRAEECTFVTYTVRFVNRGFFPAEWISLTAIPADGTEVLALPDNSAHVLPAGARGDLSVTILRRGEGTGAARGLNVSCYVFGRKIGFSVQAE